MIGEKRIYRSKNIPGPVKEKVYQVFWEKVVDGVSYKLCRNYKGQDLEFALWVEYSDRRVIAYKPYKPLNSAAAAIRWVAESFGV